LRVVLSYLAGASFLKAPLPGGYDWTKRYPWIVEAALKNRSKHFVIDGEAVILGVDGISDFNALHSGKHNGEVQIVSASLSSRC
jgi:ATP-dependent DNA ligase